MNMNMKKKIFYVFMAFVMAFVLPQFGNAAIQGKASSSIIKPPVAMLTITSPKGGEQWEVGKNYTISWNYEGYISTDIEKIKIWTEKVDSQTLKFVLDKNIVELSESDIEDGESSGIFLWTADTLDPSPSEIKKLYVEATLKNRIKYKGYKNFYIVKTEDIPVGSVTVTHPNGGERFFLGKNINITWQTDKELSDVNFFRIYLIKKSTGEKVVAISENVAQWTRNYYWNYSLSSINSKVLPGNDYAIKIELCDNMSCSYYDESDLAFSLADKVNYSIIVTSPEQPGLLLETGQSFDIKWDYLGDLTSSNVKEVRINLEKVDGMTYVFDSNIATLKKEDIPKGQNSGIYSWTVSSNGTKELRDYYRVSVKIKADNGKEYSDAGDSSFQIGVKGISDSIIIVQNPNGGGKYPFGYNLNSWGTVKDWETNLKPTDYFKAVLIKKSTGEEVLTLATNPAMIKDIFDNGKLKPSISFWWTVPKDGKVVKPGNDYAIKLILCESNTVCNGAYDTSDRAFSILESDVKKINTFPGIVSKQIPVSPKKLNESENGYLKWCYNFDKNLRIGDNNKDGFYLISALRREHLLPPGAAGETKGQNIRKFDKKTVEAVVVFQEKYADEILKPNGLKFGTGLVGKSTRVKLNKLYGCDKSKNEKKTQSFEGMLTPQGIGIFMWGSHKIKVNNVSYLVRAENSRVSDGLKKNENKKVKIIGTSGYYDIDGGFWGITAEKIVSE